MSNKQKKLMSERDQQSLIDKQLHNIQGAIRSLAYFRVVSEQINNDRPSSFWRSTRSVHIEHFVSAWSKCFGAQSEDLHWKNIIKDSSSFRSRLCNSIGVEKHEFRKYNKQLLNFRNKVIAHTDISLQEIQVPSFQNAFKAFSFLHHELISELSNFKQEFAVHRGPLDISIWYDNMVEEVDNIIGRAMEATTDLDEHH